MNVKASKNMQNNTTKGKENDFVQSKCSVENEQSLDDVLDEHSDKIDVSWTMNAGGCMD